MPFAVELIEDAERDILDIYTYILEHDSREAANHVFGELEKLCSSLAELPQRGHVPPPGIVTDQRHGLPRGPLQTLPHSLRNRYRNGLHALRSGWQTRSDHVA